MVLFAGISGAASSGRLPTLAPTLQYSGSGTSNNGKFQITNYNSSYTYSVSGGSVSYDSGLGLYVFTVSSTTGSGTISARSPKSISDSSSITAWRHVPDQTSVPFIQCYNPCGNCNTSVNPHTWSCGCGSGCNDSGGGAWGDCVCRGPGYSYWNSYSSSGYTWSGSDYTNGQGEWWKIT